MLDTFEQETARMQQAGFIWDPSHQGYARWTHTPTGVTALRQPYMTDQQWNEHKGKKCVEAAQQTPVFLVSCVSLKRAEMTEAQELYVSDWFKKARRYVQGRGAWYILSAEHGLLSPSTVIAPYERTLNRMTVSERRAWASRVVGQLAEALPHTRHFVVLAGFKYREFLKDYLISRGEVEIPLEGLKIGEQLAYLKNPPRRR